MELLWRENWKKVVEKAKIVRKQLEELYEERNGGEGWRVWDL